MPLYLDVHTISGGVATDAAATVHREAHALVARDIYQVQEGP